MHFHPGHPFVVIDHHCCLTRYVSSVCASVSRRQKIEDNFAGCSLVLSMIGIKGQERGEKGRKREKKGEKGGKREKSREKERKIH